MNWRPILLAWQFLTRLPLPRATSTTDHDVGLSLAAYPLVGLGIGLVLWLSAWLAAGVEPWVSAAVVLSLWVLITGALHLDGLADSADAWLGGYGDRQRSLDIMRDPYCGPAAVVLLVLVLLSKFAALTVLCRQPSHWLIYAPLLGRAAIVGLFLTTPYVRRGGLGSALALHAPRRLCMLALGTTLLFTFVCAGGRGLSIIIIGVLIFILLRALMIQRLGGATGDTTGALVELLETTVLISLAWQIS